jgi:pimeloyl-ACP methyl ester carboxylesterase
MLYLFSIGGTRAAMTETMGRESFVNIAGCRTRIMRGGSGEPLLFLHGARGAPAWAPFMAALAGKFDVIVPEHPGFGGSEMPDWLDNVGDLAYFYLDFIAHLGLSGVHLVGTSLGGWIAAEIAVRDCHALATLTLVAPAGLRLQGVRKTDIFMLSLEATLRHLFHDPALTATALAHQPSETEIEIEMKNRLAMAKVAWEPRLFNPHLSKWLHRISAPTLILWGDDDRIIPSAYGPAFAEHIPGAQLVMIEACGHLPQIEKPDVFTSRIVAFVNEQRR